GYQSVGVVLFQTTETSPKKASRIGIACKWMEVWTAQVLFHDFAPWGVGPNKKQRRISRFNTKLLAVDVSAHTTHIVRPDHSCRPRSHNRYFTGVITTV
ncbi:MAG: hypothetical protein ACF8AM_03095, partial [Rhodopirellula sp. JB055]|uniref:hypothetical protein n=1 Tax=Rhodopirellula sp. JB055 TaxID=3342846 RepID=UPI00370C9D90